MHVEIWWSTKICLLYKFAFHLCTNYPVLFFLWHHSNRSLRHQTFDQFYHVLFYIRFSSFSKRRKKVTILKRNLPIYEISAHSGLKKKRKSKLNWMYCVFLSIRHLQNTHIHSNFCCILGTSCSLIMQLLFKLYTELKKTYTSHAADRILDITKRSMQGGRGVWSHLRRGILNRNIFWFLSSRFWVQTTQPHQQQPYCKCTNLLWYNGFCENSTWT